MFVTQALNRHLAFQTNGFDLGNVNQAVWYTAQGQPFVFTNMAPITNRLALHVEPILLLLAPFYWVGWGSPAFLLVVQAIVFAIGAVPLYLIAAPKLGDWPAVAIATTYLLYPALEAAVMFDFHAVTLAPTFLLFAFYFLERALRGGKQCRCRLGFIIFAGLAMATKEDMGLVVGLMGLYAGLVHRRWKPALLIWAIGWGWSLLAILGIQPLFATEGNIQGDRYTWLRDVPANPALLWTHIFEQANLPDYLWRLLAPVGGVALLAPLALLPTLPSFAINLLSDHPFTWRAEEFHYAAPIAAFVFIAATLGLTRLSAMIVNRLPQTRQTDRNRQGVNLALVFILLVISFSYHQLRGFTPLAQPFDWRPVGPHQYLGLEQVTGIATDIPLFAPLSLNPHVSSRPVLHQDFGQIAPKDWLWFDVATLPNENSVQQYIRDDLLPNYQLISAIDGYLLLAPGGQTTALPNAFYTFTQARLDEIPQYPTQVSFGDELYLLGYDIHFNRAETEQVTTYWQLTRPAPAGFNPVLFLADETGTLQGETMGNQQAPTLIWLPVEQWTPGQTMKVTFNALNWDTRDRTDYRLGLGVTTSSDPWLQTARLAPVVHDSPYAHYLLADGSVLELAVLNRAYDFPTGGARQRDNTLSKMGTRLDTRFAQAVSLRGYNPPTVQYHNESPTLYLDLQWQALSPPPDDMVRFVHVVSDGQLIGQWDSWPVNGQYPLNLWKSGEYVSETVAIPLQSDPAANTVIHVGWYARPTGQRLFTDSGADHLEIVLK